MLKTKKSKLDSNSKSESNSTVKSSTESPPSSAKDLSLVYKNQKTKGMGLLKSFIQYYKPHRKLFALDLFCAFMVAILDILFPVFANLFMDDFIPNHHLNLILIYGGIFIGLYLFRTAAYYIMAYWGHIVGVRMEFDMRGNLFKHIQNMDVEFFDNNKTGQIMSRLTNDLRDVTELAHHGPEDLFISIVMLIGTFTYLVFVNLWLTLILVVFVGVLIWYTVSMRKKMLKAFKNTRRKHAEINAHLESTISGIRLSKSFANEEYDLGRFDKNNYRYYQSYKAAYKVMANYAATTTFLTDILSVVSLVAGGIFAFYGKITIQQLVVFLLYTTIFVRPVRRLIQFTQQFQSGFAGFSRFSEVMDIEPKIMDKPNAIKLTEPKGEIEFRNVNFRYLPTTDWILRNFSIKIDPGKTVALVGPSGVGKTTITHLIPRFYDLSDKSKGEILIDGNNIKDLELDSIRGNIGFVQQDVIVFYGTIKDNILYSKPDATDEEIMQAAKLANIHEFISSLPEKYDEIVGERGVRLSGGQKQRLSLARVFLKNPPILILDEATSSLDNATELAIQESIEKLAKNRTTIIVAHRLSTIKNADEILVLTDEGVTERGNHEELLAKNGIYADLYKAQFKGYIPDSIN
ncbi:MAG: ABC transporter ATP-binding protein [Promethearchaeota archaeon]